MTTWLRLAALSLLLATFALVPAPSGATSFVYTALLTPEVLGATGTGSVQIDWDDVLHTMRVQSSFSGLSGFTTQAHIHAPTLDARFRHRPVSRRRFRASPGFRPASQSGSSTIKRST